MRQSGGDVDKVELLVCVGLYVASVSGLRIGGGFFASTQALYVGGNILVGVVGMQGVIEWPVIAMVGRFDGTTLWSCFCAFSTLKL